MEKIWPNWAISGCILHDEAQQTGREKISQEKDNNKSCYNFTKIVRKCGPTFIQCELLIMSISHCDNSYRQHLFPFLMLLLPSFAVQFCSLFWFIVFFFSFVSFLFFYLFAMYKNVRVMYCVCWPKWGALFVLTLSTDIHTLYASRISCQKMFMESVRISVFEPVYAFACEINTFFLWLDVSLFVEALWIQKKKTHRISKNLRLCSASDVCVWMCTRPSRFWCFSFFT